MPQNTKDSQGGKTHPAKASTTTSKKVPDKSSADSKAASPTGSHNKGQKKTTP